MNNTRTFLTTVAMGLIAFLLLMLLLVSCTTAGQKQYTEQMQSCVESGKTWVLAEGRSDTMECK